MQIDGALSGKKWDINPRNLGRVLSTQMSLGAHAALFDGRLWSVSATVTPGAANAEYFYLLNNNTLFDIVISRINIRHASSETSTLARVTGTATSTTAIAPVNRNFSSSNVPNSTVAGGTNIGGLTPGLTLEQFTGTVSGDIDLTNRPLIVSPTTAIALSALAGSIATSYIIDFYLQTIEPPDF